MFLTLVEKGSFSNAARELHISSQGLSYAITRMEEEFGIPLFKRGSRGVTLNREGELVFEDVKKIVSRYDYILKRVEASKSNSRNRIRLGVVSTLNNMLFPMLYDDFCIRYPDIKFYIGEYTGELLSREILDERMDLGFSFDVHEREGIDSIRISKEGWCILVNEDNPLAGKESVCFKDLADVRLAVANHYFIDLDMFTELFKKQGMEIDIMYAFASSENLDAFLKYDVGAIICATYIARRLAKEEKVVMIPLNEELEPYYVCLMYKEGKEQPQQIRQVIDFFREKIEV